jgi:hypothetical protein
VQCLGCLTGPVACSAVELFRSQLFETNSWQHRLPEYIVAGPEYVTGQPGSLQGVLAAGYWDNAWHFRSDSGFSKC